MKISAAIVTAFIILTFQLIGSAFAGDYVSLPLPKAYPDRAEFDGEFAKPPSDPQACRIYLKNLRYFTSHALPMSCGEQVAPTLVKKIQPVEWERLDPVKYAALFNALAKRTFAPLRGAERQGATWNTFLEARRQDAEHGAIVFRRAKLVLTGHVLLPNSAAPTADEISFQVIQFGYDVANPQHPFPGMRCGQVGARVMRQDLQDTLDLFSASQDLTTLYSRMTDLQIGSASYFNLWIINGRPYGEQYDERGNVLLAEVRSDDFVRACFFGYRNAK